MGGRNLAGETARRASYQGLTAGFAFIAFAVAILLAWVRNDWWSMPPILLIEFGVYGIMMGSLMTRPSGEGSLWASDSAYVLLWGCLSAILGVIWFANGYFPNIAPVSIAVVLIFIGGFILALSLSKTRKSSK
jgi:hypothetical protein